MSLINVETVKTKLKKSIHAEFCIYFISVYFINKIDTVLNRHNSVAWFELWNI